MLYVIGAPIRPIFSNQENTTFELVSLAIVCCSFLSMGLIIIPEVLLLILIFVCHKSSIDQLIFTHWKRLTQLSKHFFFPAEQVPTPMIAHGPKFLDNNYACSCCGNSLVGPTVQSQFVSFHTKYFQSGR